MTEKRYLNQLIDIPQRMVTRFNNLYWQKYPDWHLQFKKFADEEFREIKEYDGLYFISNYGQVVSFHRKNPYVLLYSFEYGLYTVLLHFNGIKTKMYVHHLVYTHFVGEVPPGKKVIHRSKVTTDNYYKNLELAPKFLHEKRGQRKFDFSLYQQIKDERGPLGSRKKAVLQFDLEGKFIKKFPSVKAASMACKQGGGQPSMRIDDSLTIGDYQWRYKDDPLFKNGIIDIEPVPADYKPVQKPVLQFDREGNFIKEYPSLIKACQVVNVNFSTILNCTKKMVRTARGFQWRFKDDPEIQGEKPKLKPISNAMSRRSQSILQYTWKGEFIKKYGSIIEAADANEIFYEKIIECLKGKSRTSGGFQWKYQKGRAIPRRIPAVKMNSNPKRSNSKPVLQFSKEGKFIKEYPSARAAAKELKIPINEILHCVRNRVKTKKFIWKRKSDPLFKNGIIDISPGPTPGKKSLRPILQYDLEGNFIREFSSIYKAARAAGIYYSHISGCIEGKQKTAGGFIWREKTSEKPELKIEKPKHGEHGDRKHPHAVLEFNLKGKFIRKYPSISDASRKTKISTIQITNCLRGLNPTAKARQWRKADDPLFKDGIKNIDPVRYPGSPRQPKPVLQFDRDGIFIREYSSITRAARELKTSVGVLLMVIQKKTKTARDFQWRFKNDPLFKNGIVNIEPVKMGYVSSAVVQFDLNGHFLREYPSIKEASAASGARMNGISQCATGTLKKAGGFQWRYRQDPLFANGIVDIEPLVRAYKTKAVLQFDQKGNYLDQYSSVKEAECQTGISFQVIRRCSLKQTKTSGGYQWRYQEDPLFAHGITNIEPVPE